MRKFIDPRYIILPVIVISGLAGCSVKESFVPVETGDEITFGSSLPGNVQTRTIYGDEILTDPETGNRYYPVYWDNDDYIAVYCPQSSNTVRSDYKVTPAVDTEGNPTNTSASVTKTGDTGLQWGQTDIHDFYGFYPASAVTGVDGDGLIYASVPVLQDPVRFEESVDADGNRVIRGIANTDYAYMWAYTQVDKSVLPEGTDVPLTFHPLNTILEITVNGPTENSSPVKISSINVNAVDPDGAGQNIYLTGDFKCDFNRVKDGTQQGANPECDVAGNLNEVRNRITISCYNEETGDYISLGPGDKLVLHAYLLPNDDGFEVQTLQVSVSPVNSQNLVKTLQTGQILAHKVNRVSLPYVKTGGTNYWQDSLDPDIYITELSLPGSKMSMLTEANGSNVIYQNASIEDQFQAGVRAFIIQTGALYDAGNNIFNPQFRSGELYACVDGKRLNNYSLENILTILSEALTEAEAKGKEYEYVFVQLTYDGGTTDNEGWAQLNTEEAWIRTLEYSINNLKSKYALRIYTNEITPQTTIDDVKGKIILKANFNSTEMGNKISASAGIPCLFSLWNVAYVPEGVPLSWGSPNSSVQKSSSMKWLYQEVTSVGVAGSGAGEDGPDGKVDINYKKQYAEALFTSSVNKYNEPGYDHSWWFMNDLGGSFVGGSYSGDPSSQGIIDLTLEMAPFAVRQLQERSENASLGLIFFNFADNLPESGQKYGTASLIQTIVDNNFKFALHKKSASATGAVVRPVTRSESWDK